MKNNKSIKFKSLLLYVLVLSLVFVSVVQVLPANAATSSKITFDKILSEKMNAALDNERINVSVWVKDINQNEVKEKTKKVLKEESGFSDNKLEIIDTDFSNSRIESVDVETIGRIDKTISVDESELIIEKKREIASQMYEESNSDIFDSFNIDDKYLIYSCKYAPNILMSLTKDEINTLCQNQNITEIYYYDREAENLGNEDNFDTSFSSSNLRSIYNFSTEQYEVTGIDTMRDVLGYSGNGIKIGIIDYPFAVSNEIDYFINDPFELYYCSSDAIIDAYTSHGNGMASLIAGYYYNETTGDEFIGAVPDAKLYATAGIDFRIALEVLLNSGVNVINSSMLFGGDGYNNYGDTAKWIDHIVSEHSVSYVASAGNNGANNIGSGQMAYNSITVGCCDSDGNISSYSSYNNTATKQYKPDLVAPGKNIVLPSTRNSSTDNPSAWSGTSLSAPIVTSAVAQLCEASSVLKYNPILMKSAILAGSKITGGMSISTTLNRQYGAGMVNVLNSYGCIVTKGNYASGTISTSTSTVTHTMNINARANQVIRVSAVWEKPNTISGTHSSGTIISPSIDKFSIKITDPNNTEYTSYFAYDNKNVVSFVASGGGNYTIQLIRQGTAVSNNIRYGIVASVQNQ
jgi:hypothetical protein